MIKKYTVLFLCLGLLGCSTVERLKLSHKYHDIYDNGVNANDITIIVKHEEYQELKQKLASCLFLSGYTKVIFEDPKHGFMVLAQEDIFHSSQIILKYTKITGAYKTQIDFVRASNDLYTNSRVNEDIKAIAERMKNE